MTSKTFKGRVDAAQKLVSKLKKFEGARDTCVVGLLRGGAVTAKVLSDFLLLPMQALIVKKIGAPQNTELAIGAMVDKRNIYKNREFYKSLKITKEVEAYLIDQKMEEIKILRRKLMLNKIKIYDNVILADDGVATGATAIAANNYLRGNGAKEVFLASPIIAFDTLTTINKYFDNVYFLEKPKEFRAVSQFYESFPQVTNEEVAAILNSKTSL